MGGGGAKLPGMGSPARGRKNPTSESWSLLELRMNPQRTRMWMQVNYVEDGREGVV